MARDAVNTDAQAIIKPVTISVVRDFRPTMVSLAKVRPLPKLLITLGLVTQAALLSSCAYIDRADPSTITQVNPQALRDANANTLKIRRIFQSRRMALDTLPVGSIVPYYNPKSLKLPENWRYCNGDTLRDPKSPLDGMVLPNLIDARFLAGSVDEFGVNGGSNDLVAAGEHTHDAATSRSGLHDHGGSTGISQNNGRVRELEEPGEVRVRLVDQAHSHAVKKEGVHVHGVIVQPSGVHDHGGDRRPRWFGVLYIIKIK